MLSHYRDRYFFNRVLAPEGEILCKNPSLVFALRVVTKSAPGGFVFCSASATALSIDPLEGRCSTSVHRQPCGGIHAVEKKVSKEKAARLPLMPCALRICRGGRQNGLPALYALWVICLRAASMPHPFGLFPTNTAVLDAANGRKNTSLFNVSY